MALCTLKKGKRIVSGYAMNGDLKNYILKFVQHIDFVITISLFQGCRSNFMEDLNYKLNKPRRVSAFSRISWIVSLLE